MPRLSHTVEQILAKLRDAGPSRTSSLSGPGPAPLDATLSARVA